MEHPSEQRSLLTYFTLGHFANDWVAGAIWLLTPAIAASMGLSPAEIGLLLAINGIGAGLAYIPAGIFADQIGRRGLFLLLTFWWVALGYFAASFAPDFWSLTLILTIAVMGDAAWHPVATGLLVQRMPQQRARVLGIHAMGGTLGAEVLGPLSVGLLLSVFDWRTVLQISVLPAVLMGLAFIPMARRLVIAPLRSSVNHALELRELLTHWSSRQGIALIVVTTLYNMALIALLSMTPLYLQTHYGLSALYTAVLFAVMLLAGSLLQPLIGHHSDQLGRKRVFIVTMTIGGLCALLAATQQSFGLFIVALIAAAALFAGVRSVVLAAAVEFAGKRESTTLGLAFALMDGVGAAGALLAGLAGSADLSRAFLLAAALAFVCALLATRLSFEPRVHRSDHSLITPV